VNTSTLKKVYALLKSDLDARPNVNKSCSLLKDILCKLDFYKFWLFPEVGHCKIFLSLVLQRIKDNYRQNLNGEISNMYNNCITTHHVSSFNLIYIY